MKKKFQRGNVLLISSSHFIHDVYTAFLAPMLPLIIAKLGISLSMAGLLDVVRKIPSLFNPFIGILADKVSLRFLVIFMPAVTAVTMSLLGIAPSYLVLLILLFVTGISTALYHVPAPVMVKQMAGDETGRGMSRFMLGGELARTAGPLIITSVIALGGLESSWKMMPLGIAATVILFFKLRKIEFTQPQRKADSLSRGKTFRKLLPFFITISGISLFRAMIKLSLTLYLPTYLTGKGNAVWIAGISLSVLQLSGAAGTYFAGTLSDKFGRKRMLLLVSLVNPVLMWLFISSNSIFTFPLLLLSGFFLFASGPVMLAMVQDTDTEHPAFVNGIYMTVNFGISSLIVLLIGVLGDTWGLEITYKICALVSFGAVPFVWMIKKKDNFPKLSHF